MLAAAAVGAAEPVERSSSSRRRRGTEASPTSVSSSRHRELDDADNGGRHLCTSSRKRKELNSVRKSKEVSGSVGAGLNATKSTSTPVSTTLLGVTAAAAAVGIAASYLWLRPAVEDVLRSSVGGSEIAGPARHGAALNSSATLGRRRRHRMTTNDFHFFLENVSVTSPVTAPELVAAAMAGVGNGSDGGHHLGSPAAVEADDDLVAGEEFMTWTFMLASPWILSFAASVAIGFAGIIPAIFIPSVRRGSYQDSKRLRRLLSFSVGGLLGDVFLHLLPEAWDYQISRAGGANELRQAQVTLGFWVLIGMLSFLLVEKIIAETEMAQDDQKEGSESKGRQKGQRSRRIMGYLNLAANAVDNFSHGLAVGGGFLCSRRSGLLTTLAILIHEVPHEIADFAILLNAGFTRWQAAKAQFATATMGLCGSMAALLAEASHTKLGDRTWWILPFTAGGFLTVSLVNVLPDIMDLDEETKQISTAGCGLCAAQEVIHCTDSVRNVCSGSSRCGQKSSVGKPSRKAAFARSASMFYGPAIESGALLLGIVVMGILAHVCRD